MINPFTVVYYYVMYKLFSKNKQIAKMYQRPPRAIRKRQRSCKEDHKEKTRTSVATKKILRIIMLCNKENTSHR